ncbi:type II secretion system F family protein [Methylocystis bryophila]|uniref:Type II secretion protein F n=1 Tax=Methylocystis bryophila TaxID=655015 RepID=A0A1W6MXA2_9HYPH|nr:type II secretion system F family protein [Methylocystis bryophila]ARN82220.1 type II secretion protein F [Methylocystis bryophila]BDV38353.1 type II secretion system protein F [Methylocystis bryophila]
MPTFRYRAYSAAGDLVEGEIAADAMEEAEDALWRRGLTPFETKEVGRSAFTNPINRRRTPNLGELASFTREFATLEQADIPLDHGLRILAAQIPKPVLRELAEEILGRVVSGASLSEALAGRSDVFSSEYINVVRAGETIGNVGQALGDLADMLERRVELRSRITSALVYPAMLITLAIISTGIVLATLVPNIAPIFLDNNRPLPSGLKFILDAEANWQLLALGLFLVVAGLFLFWRAARQRPHWMMAIDRRALQIPFVGALSSQLETARFTHTLGSLLKAGVPLLPALECGRTAVSNRHLGAEIETSIEAVRGGESLSGALGRIEAIPKVVPQMVSLGEETGKLDAMLLRVAAMFEKQTERSIERVMGLVTPTLTILIAVVVGGLIMTVMDAVLGINELATK